MEEIKITREMLIRCTIEDLVYDLLVYGRKEDEELGIGEIEKAIEGGEITIKEMAEHFQYILERDLQ